MLAENLKAVQENIRSACEKAGRSYEDVKLIAVSKTKPLSDIETLITCGVNDFGENKVQELTEKYENVSRPVNFHLIGHLQTNKVKYVVGKTVLIHSVDSLHLAQEIEKESAKKNLVSDILIQINIANEETKFGIRPEETEELVRAVSKMPHIRIKGLMTIAPFVQNAELNRGLFRKMHQILLDIKSQSIDNVDMDILSMGMTNDYRVAIEEGSNMVREGTAIFGARNYNI